MEALIEKIRAAEHAARTGSAAAATDEDSTYFVAAFRQGLT
jgi:hypothetical protein